ncbi:MAG: CRISPR-associated helicase Cas3' [Firmicutes bacterium]|nr:CRISPR-associated helicase Cas3' [Bacillota bacterium]
MIYYAHSDRQKDKAHWHLLKEHLLDTADTAALFAERFGAEKLSYLGGLLHDIGKYNPEFQKRLSGENIRVDHSTPGAIEAVKKYGAFGYLLAYIIAGHHSGLPDWGSQAGESSLEFRLNKKVGDHKEFLTEIELPSPKAIQMPKFVRSDGFSVQFFIRFLYSCLVDADFLDTERALDMGRAASRPKGYSLLTLKSSLDLYLDKFVSKARDTPVNIKRTAILAACRNKANNPPGLFTLTVPTGGGKTMSSLSFALSHAVEHGMERVIYVIPYTSIIEQNAEVFRSVLGEENVLEHHSNFAFPPEKDPERDSEYASSIEQMLRAAAENWDLPIIATTNVQFFESLFASRSSRCRKLHNIANSVIILDEAQMLPTGFLKPCLNALSELVAGYHTTVVLCTATQPAINRYLPKFINPVELMEAPSALYEAFKRVDVRYLGKVTDDELAEKLLNHKQVLYIVNTKKHARLLYQRISGDDSFHLSTRMCPAHRSSVLAEIKRRLKEGAACRVVSTQLIEAGVDVDFPVVYRSMAGIDSVAQAAGRCNREGILPNGQVYVFDPESHGIPRGWLNRTASLGRQVLERYDDPMSLKAIEDYFHLLYQVEAEELDRERILADIEEQSSKLRFPFHTIAEKFKLIEDNTYTVIIPWDDTCLKTLEAAASSPFPGSFIRRLQRYGVQLFEKEFYEMLAGGFLDETAGMYFALREEVYQRYYRETTGLEPITESMLLNELLVI